MRRILSRSVIAALVCCSGFLGTCALAQAADPVAEAAVPPVETQVAPVQTDTPPVQAEIAPGDEPDAPAVGVDGALAVDGAVAPGVLPGAVGAMPVPPNYSPIAGVPPIAGPGYGQPVPDLFYNYYASPAFGSQTAPLYLCPRPVPPIAGYTYYTYQPFLPHEFMNPHYREYYNYHSLYQGGGVGYTSYNRTQVTWQRGMFREVSFRGLLGCAPHCQYHHTGYGLPLTPYQQHVGYGLGHGGYGYGGGYGGYGGGYDVGYGGANVGYGAAAGGNCPPQN